MLPIYCISLQRKRNERYSKLKNKYFKPMKLNNIEWIATDGNDYSDTFEISKKNNLVLSKLGHELNKSVVATAISHRKVWLDIIKNDKVGAIILEDDVVIYPNFKEKVMKIWDNIKNNKDIDFLLLSFSDNIVINPCQNSYNKHINKLKNFNGMFCYLIKKEGAIKLLEITKKLSYQIDIQISKKEIDFYSTKEKLAYFNNEIFTTIHNHRCKILEKYFGMTFINYKFFRLIDFYIITNYTLILLGTSFILFFFNFNFLVVNLINLFIFLTDIKLVGCRIDELNVRIKGIFKNIGSYDSDEFINKLVDHLLFSLSFTILNFFIKHFF